ncbi:MAG: hypothetical protein IIC04_01060 [Proteobacteria bacterium]|nr:hypothetical protein [Pseudomonadota bacterium]
MEETQAAEAESPSMSNIVGLAMIVIILGLGVMIWNQNTKLEETVKVLAAVSAKCAQK